MRDVDDGADVTVSKRLEQIELECGSLLVLWRHRRAGTVACRARFQEGVLDASVRLSAAAANARLLELLFGKFQLREHCTNLKCARGRVVLFESS
eukprot:6213722-Pleurochrysis_carterae.AAC.1